MLANALRQLGMEVTRTPDVGLLGAMDEEQLAFAFTEGRVLVTQDIDFVLMHDSGAPHCGIVYGPKDRRTNRELIDGITLVWDCCTPDEMVGKLERI